jgi:energy-converting hydrogenase B subunit D
VQPFQYVVLLLAGITGTVVVFARRPARQIVLLSMYGLVLSVVFFAFSAPDVALSEIAVGAVLLPIMTLLTIAKTGEREE